MASATGRPTSSVKTSATTHYVYDRSGRLLAEASSTGTTQREYVWIDDLPLALFADFDTGTPKQWFVHPDHLNRPTKMTDDIRIEELREATRTLRTVPEVW